VVARHLIANNGTSETWSVAAPSPAPIRAPRGSAPAGVTRQQRLLAGRGDSQGVHNGGGVATHAGETGGVKWLG
jgi:hypothetical protein